MDFFDLCKTHRKPQSFPSLEKVFRKSHNVFAPRKLYIAKSRSLLLQSCLIQTCILNMRLPSYKKCQALIYTYSSVFRYRSTKMALQAQKVSMAFKNQATGKLSRKKNDGSNMIKCCITDLLVIPSQSATSNDLYM